MVKHPFSIIEEGSIIEDDVVIGSCVFVGRRSVIGAGTRIQHGAFVARGSVIGHNVFIGPHAVLTDDKFPKAGNTHYHAEPPVLEDGCSIGAGAVILPGVIVHHGATVGAGAVVIDNVPPNCVVRGVPGRVFLTDAYHN